jgi:hypothetical protein
MNPVVENAATTAIFISIYWEPILSDEYTGRDIVIYYKLEYDQGNNTWFWLNNGSNTLITNFTMS